MGKAQQAAAYRIGAISKTGSSENISVTIERDGRKVGKVEIRPTANAEGYFDDPTYKVREKVD